MLVSSRATVRAHTVRCPSWSTVTEPFEGLTRQLHNFLSKKKKKKKEEPLANRKFQEPSALKRKILAGTYDRRTGEVDKRWASFTIFSTAKWINKAGPWSGCPVSNPDPNNTIGLFDCPLLFFNKTKNTTFHSNYRNVRGHLAIVLVLVFMQTCACHIFTFFGLSWNSVVSDKLLHCDLSSTATCTRTFEISYKLSHVTDDTIRWQN